MALDDCSKDDSDAFRAQKETNNFRAHCSSAPLIYRFALTNCLKFALCCCGFLSLCALIVNAAVDDDKRVKARLIVSRYFPTKEKRLKKKFFFGFQFLDRSRNLAGLVVICCSCTLSSYRFDAIGRGASHRRIDSIVLEFQTFRTFLLLSFSFYVIGIVFGRVLIDEVHKTLLV